LAAAVLAGLVVLAPSLAAAAAPAAGLAALEPVKPAGPCEALAQADLAAAVGAKVILTAQTVSVGPAPYCAVRGTIAPKIGFEVRLPTEGWTQRFVQLGCGGLCGTLAIRPEHDADCTPVTGGATVLASTDMGHAGGGMGNGAFGKDPQLRADFAWRGVHLTALAAKALIARYYGRPARYAYFYGCSDGGREALMEAQRFPEDFDGIAAGAPAMNFQVQNTFYHAWQARSNLGPDGLAILTAAKLPALHRAAVAACDAADGLKDGQITDPRACRFDPAAAQCPPGQAPSDDCLTAAEVEVARKFYAGPRDAAGHRFTLGGPQVGSELAWRGVYVPDTPSGRMMSPDAALQVIKYLAFDPNPPETATLRDFRFDQATFDRLAALHPLYDSTDTDLGPFQRRGGKLLLWHGWSDPHISPINTIAYYDGVQAVLGEARTRAFARLFLFPGLYHCGGGDGPAEFDVLTPLMAWVESGQAPDRIVAGRAVGAPPPGPPPAGGAALADRPPPRPAGPVTTDRTRPVFAYPLVARYSGQGSIDTADSFVAGQPLVQDPKAYAWAGSAFMSPDIKR
jgi:feruloyl esterase